MSKHSSPQGATCERRNLKKSRGSERETKHRDEKVTEKFAKILVMRERGYAVTVNAAETHDLSYCRDFTLSNSRVLVARKRMHSMPRKNSLQELPPKRRFLSQSRSKLPCLLHHLLKVCETVHKTELVEVPQCKVKLQN